VLFAEPVDSALAQAWSVRVQQGSSTRWRGFVDRWATRDQLPPSLDVARLATHWADRIGRDEVHVVVAPRSIPKAVSTTADVLHLPSRSGRALRPQWRDLGPDAVDALRRLNGLLGVRAGDEQRAGAVRTFLDLHEDAAPTGQRLTVPERHLEWARDTAKRMADQLTAGGYPVHGRLGELVPAAVGAPSRPRRHEVLGVVIWACLRRTTAMQDGKAAT
jgi:hypothetical protein